MFVGTNTFKIDAVDVQSGSDNYYLVTAWLYVQSTALNPFVYYELNFITI
jgi:hypothetical protein